VGRARRGKRRRAASDPAHRRDSRSYGSRRLPPSMFSNPACRGRSRWVRHRRVKGSLRDRRKWASRVGARVRERREVVCEVGPRPAFIPGHRARSTPPSRWAVPLETVPEPLRRQRVRDSSGTLWRRAGAAAALPSCREDYRSSAGDRSDLRRRRRQEAPEERQRPRARSPEETRSRLARRPSIHRLRRRGQEDLDAETAQGAVRVDTDGHDHGKRDPGPRRRPAASGRHDPAVLADLHVGRIDSNSGPLAIEGQPAIDGPRQRAATGLQLVFGLAECWLPAPSTVPSGPRTSSGTSTTQPSASAVGRPRLSTKAALDPSRTPPRHRRQPGAAS
jgi:hypothetical protein